MNTKYGYFVRELVRPESLTYLGWDVFLAAFSSARRSVSLWEQVSSIPCRMLLIHKEYAYDRSELPPGEHLHSDGLDEAEFIDNVVTALEQQTGKSISGISLAIDITAFMRPELIYLVVMLRKSGIKSVDFFYSEPARYRRKLWTTFSSGSVSEVRQIRGCEGLHDPANANDLLVIGTGYDDMMMSLVAAEKPRAKKALLYGFPSLASDMYQENVWRVSRSEEEIGGGGDDSFVDRLFAPASDPFETATVVSECVTQARKLSDIENVYLSPLGTKAQVLGFALYYAMECLGSDVATSVLLPFSSAYDRVTGEGVGRTWRYRVEFC